MFAAGELGVLYPLHDLGRATPLLVADTWDRLDLAVDGVPCAPGAPALGLVEGDGIALEGAHGCPGGGTLTIVAGYLQTFEVGHETEIEVDGKVVGAVDRSSPIARVPLVRTYRGATRWRWSAALALAVLGGLAWVAVSRRGRRGLQGAAEEPPA